MLPKTKRLTHVAQRLSPEWIVLSYDNVTSNPWNLSFNSFVLFRTPRPKCVDGRVIWDRLKLDLPFSDLTEDTRVKRMLMEPK
jgi:hypothetical protein